MIKALASVSLPRLRLLLTLLAIAVGLSIAASQPSTVPQADSLDYMGYARSLYLTGSYSSTPAGPEADAQPGREPLYPALAALTARVVPSLASSLTSCSPPAEGCHKGFKVLAYLNGLLLGLATGFTLLALAELGGGRLAHLVTAAYLILNLHITKDMRYAISDFLAMACVALAVWLLARACRKGTAAGWIAAGLALAALALTKASFLPFAALLTVWFGLRGLWNLRQRGLKALVPMLALSSMLLAINGGWMARNLMLFGVTSDNRGAIVLSTREVFDHMTPQEHLAAWVWWTRGPGNGLAKKWFPPEVWKRHEWYEENGFFLQGQVARHEQRLAEIQAQHPDWTSSKKFPLETKMVIGEILSDIPDYLATMPVMIYRGLWCDEFMVIGFPLLILISIRALRRRDGAELAALVPGWWSLLFYAAVSLNIPRYQMTAMTALALATGLYVQSRVERKRLIPANT
jgi:4-amino-4-deoxy-L-arabinose transferase-like glycosyltransferase